jgi:hypothetical protein
MRGFCKGECAVSVVTYGSDILGTVTVVMRVVNYRLCYASRNVQLRHSAQIMQLRVCVWI